MGNLQGQLPCLIPSSMFNICLMVFFSKASEILLTKILIFKRIFGGSLKFGRWWGPTTCYFLLKKEYSFSGGDIQPIQDGKKKLNFAHKRRWGHKNFSIISSSLALALSLVLAPLVLVLEVQV